MNISKEGLALIKRFEGCELKAYRCPANVLTIGYGHTKNVTEDMEITQQEANDMLDEELIEYCEYIDKMVKVSLNQNQFDALVAWIYNLGPTNFRNSTLLAVIIAEALLFESKKGKQSPGRPGGKGPKPDKRWNKGDKFMTPLRQMVKTGKPKIAKKGWK